MKTLLLIPCGKEKEQIAKPARELYRGNIFKASLNFAIRQNMPFAILSAKYGVVQPEEILSPYEIMIKTQSEEYRLSWANDIKSKLNGFNLFSICGAEYELPLLRVGVKLVSYLNGFTQGYRLKALTENQTLEQLGGVICSNKMQNAIDQTCGIELPCHKIRHLVRTTNLTTNELLVCGSLMGIDHKTIKAQIWRTRNGKVK